jgi:hypothetical protein
MREKYYLLYKDNQTTLLIASLEKYYCVACAEIKKVLSAAGKIDFKIL